MANLYQVGSEVNKPPYTGDDSTMAFYGGQFTTIAKTVTASDTVEVQLFELPVGVRANGIKWAISDTFGVGSTASIVIRKKSDIISTDGAQTGTVTGVAGLKTITDSSGSTALAITATAKGSGQQTIIPTQFEGLTVPKSTTQDSYIVALKVVSGTTTFPAVTVFVGIEGEFIGTL